MYEWITMLVIHRIPLQATMLSTPLSRLAMAATDCGSLAQVRRVEHPARRLQEVRVKPGQVKYLLHLRFREEHARPAE